MSRGICLQDDHSRHRGVRAGEVTSTLERSSKTKGNKKVNLDTTHLGSARFISIHTTVTFGQIGYTTVTFVCLLGSDWTNHVRFIHNRRKGHSQKGHFSLLLLPIRFVEGLVLSTVLSKPSGRLPSRKPSIGRTTNIFSTLAVTTQQRRLQGKGQWQ